MGQLQQIGEEACELVGDNMITTYLHEFEIDMEARNKAWPDHIADWRKEFEQRNNQMNEDRIHALNTMLDMQARKALDAIRDIPPAPLDLTARAMSSWCSWLASYSLAITQQTLEFLLSSQKRLAELSPDAGRLILPNPTDTGEHEWRERNEQILLKIRESAENLRGTVIHAREDAGRYLGEYA